MIVLLCDNLNVVYDAITRFRVSRAMRHVCERSRTIDPKNRHIHDHPQHAYIWSNYLKKIFTKDYTCYSYEEKSSTVTDVQNLRHMDYS